MKGKGPAGAAGRIIIRRTAILKLPSPQDLPRPSGCRRSNKTILFHHFDKSCGAVEPDAEPPLDHRDRGLSCREDEIYGLLIILIPLHSAAGLFFFLRLEFLTILL